MSSFLKSWVGSCQRGGSDKVWRAVAIAGEATPDGEPFLVLVEFGRRLVSSQHNFLGFGSRQAALDYFDAKVAEKLTHGYLPGSWEDRDLFRGQRMADAPVAWPTQVEDGWTARTTIPAAEVSPGCDLSVAVETAGMGRTPHTRHQLFLPAEQETATIWCPEERGRLAVVLGPGAAGSPLSEEPWYGVAAVDSSWGRHSFTLGRSSWPPEGTECCGWHPPLLLGVSPGGEVRGTLVHRTTLPLSQLIPPLDSRLTRRRPLTDEVARIGEREGDRLHLAGCLIHLGTTSFLWVDRPGRGRCWDGRDETEVRATPELAITPEGVCMPIAARSLMNGHEAALRSAVPQLQPHLLTRRLQSL